MPVRIGIARQKFASNAAFLAGHDVEDGDFENHFSGSPIRA
jgi:hypothetical protein